MSKIINKNKKKTKEIYDSEAYKESRNEEFNAQFRKVFTRTVGEIDLTELNYITEDEIQIFINNFTFPSEHAWKLEKTI